MDADWDLNAVVRSCSSIAVASSATGAAAITQQVPFAGSEEHDEDPFWFSNLLKKQSTNPFHELEQINIPFFSITNKSPQISVPQSSTSNLHGFKDPNSSIHLPNQQLFYQEKRACPGPKKRKIQPNRVVQEVIADSVPDDTWAWRKYGQKPIKGSPYPRNYYRCSSSKGCLARKQVERSNSNPNMFIISYTGEHSHPRPSHRNLLAGSTRDKFPTATTTAVAGFQHPVTISRSPSLSPTTPLMNPLTEEKINQYESYDDEFVFDDILIPNITINNEDIFLGFQELGNGINH